MNCKSLGHLGLAVIAVFAMGALSGAQGEGSGGLNAGADLLVRADDGTRYLPDLGWTEGGDFGYIGGHARWITTDATPRAYIFVEGSSSERSLYHMARVDSFTYRFRLEPQTYEVTMRFAEGSADGPGFNAVDIFFNGELAVDSLDVWNEVGKYRSLDVRRIATVTDSLLDVRVEGRVGFGYVNAVSIRPIGEDEPELPGVQRLDVVPTYGGSLLDWEPPGPGGHDGYLVEATLLDGTPVWDERTYLSWAICPGDGDYIYSVKALDATGRAGESRSIASPGERSHDASPLGSMELLLSESDLRRIQGALPEHPWVEAQLRADGETRLGRVRFRGEASLLQSKKSFKFRIEEGSRVNGAEMVNLVANYKDETLVGELLARELMESIGLDAYGMKPVRLFINGDYAGVYEVLEEADEDYLERIGRDVNGYAYKVECGLFPLPDVSEYRRCYENLNAEDWERDEVAVLVEDLYTLASEDQETWLRANVDVDRLIDWYAAQVFVSNNDFSIHNFIIYRERVGGLWSIFPWDIDACFRDPTFPANFSSSEFPDSRDGSHSLANILMAVPNLKRRYLLRFRDLLDHEFSLDATDSIYKALVELTQSDGVIDPHKRTREDNREYYRELLDFRDDLAIRDESLRESIDSLMPPPWVDLVLNEVIFGEGEAGGREVKAVELRLRGDGPVELGALFLTADEAGEPWGLPDTTLYSGDRLVLRLPDAAKMATILAIGVDDSTDVDRVDLSTFDAVPAVGRYPDGYGRHRALPIASPGEPNQWKPEVEVAATTDAEFYGERDIVRLQMGIRSLWRQEIHPEIQLRAHGEGHVRLVVPPVYEKKIKTLAKGDGWQDEITIALAKRSNISEGRYDLVVHVLDQNTGAAMADPVTATFFVDEGPALPLAINEICADNESVLADELGEYDDWIELINTTDEPISLSDYYLTDDFKDEPYQWALPDTEILPGARGVIWADKAPEQGAWHANFSLSKNGDEVSLVRPGHNGPKRMDHILFGPQYPDWSFGRYSDGRPSWERFSVPTPGEMNVGPVLP